MLDLAFLAFYLFFYSYKEIVLVKNFKLIDNGMMMAAPLNSIGFSAHFIVKKPKQDG